MTTGSAEPAAANAVTAGGGPTTRLRRLGIRLFALREIAGLSAEEAGRLAGVSKATVSRYERGKGNVRWLVVEKLGEVYGAAKAEREELVDLAKNSKATDAWWMSFGGIPEYMRLLLALENEAGHIRQYTVGVIPGLLQTMVYAQNIKATPGKKLPDADLQEHLALRMRRQQILDRPAPPRYDVILDEAVLRRVVGDPDIMAAQIDHLLERGQQDTITIQVLPSAGGAWSAGLSTHVIYGDFGGPALDVAFLEHQIGGVFLEDAPDVEEYAGGFEHLRREALDPTASAELIAEVRDKYLNTRK